MQVLYCKWPWQRPFASHFVVKSRVPSSSLSHAAGFLASKATFDSKPALRHNLRVQLRLSIFQSIEHPKGCSVAPYGGVGPNFWNATGERAFYCRPPHGNTFNQGSALKKGGSLGPRSRDPYRRRGSFLIPVASSCRTLPSQPRAWLRSHASACDLRVARRRGSIATDSRPARRRSFMMRGRPRRSVHRFQGLIDLVLASSTRRSRRRKQVRSLF